MSLNSGSLELTFPWPPSVNHYKRPSGFLRSKNGGLYQKRVDTNETKVFYWEAYLEIKRLAAAQGAFFDDSADFRLGVCVDLYPPDGRRYDADNRLKVLLDGLVKYKAIHDDSQITRLLVEKRAPFPNGKAVVTIYRIEVETCTLTT